MANPDLRRYVDLTLFDKDPQDVFDAALALAQARLPEWEPREGNTEVALLEGLALEVAELMFAINRLPDAVAAVLFRLFDVEPDPGTRPTAVLRIEVADDRGYDLPPGVRAALDVPGSDEAVIFTTDVGVVIPPGSTSVTVAATGDRRTAAANGIDAAELELIDSIFYVDGVHLEEPVEGGAWPETDAEWHDRAAERLGRLVTTLVLPEHFTRAALERTEVARALTVDLYDPNGPGDPGDDPGHVTVAVLGPDGDPLDPADADALLDDLTAAALAPLFVHVIDPTITDVDVDVSVVASSGYSSAQAEDAIVEALEEHLDPLTWDWSDTVRRNRLLAVIGALEEVAYVDTLTTPAADLGLAGVAPLTRPGVLTVTATTA